jgi:hypothetical protein
LSDQPADLTDGLTPIASLALQAKVINLLENQAGVIYVENLTRYSREVLRKVVPGMGDKVLATVAKAIEAKGIKVPDSWRGK